MMKKDKNVVQSVFAKLICMLVVLLIVFGNTINVYADTSDNGKMWYSTSANYTFNVKGYYNGSLLSTTYFDSGYLTYIKVNGFEMPLYNFSYNGASQTCIGITVQQNLSFVSNGNYVKIEYVLTNNNSSAATISLATGADIMIGSNDHAPIENLSGNKGIRMSDNGVQFMFIGRDSYGVTNVDTYWFGTYSSWRDNKYVQSYTYQGSSADSGMAWSWKNRTIQSGETQKYSVLIGIGQLNNAPTLNVTSSVKDTYYRGEIVNIQGTVNDVDYGDVLKVKYAVDDGTEYEIGQSFTPNGTETPFDLNFTIPTNLSVGTHQLKIWVADDKGNMSSPKVVNFTVSPFAPPTAPTYKNITQNSFTVEWGTNGNDSGVIYELYDVTDNKTVYSGTGTSVTLSGFSPNEKRQYKARIKNNHGSYSDYTSVTTVYTNAIQPLSKGYDNITSNSVRLLWNPNGNPSYTNYHYEVRKKSDNSVVAQGTVNGTSVTITGLSGGHTQYRYFVRAKNGNNEFTDFTELIIPSLVVYQKSNYAKAEWTIKFDYATKAELYRDGTRVYEGLLSDYDDYAATDKAVPNPVSNINLANTGNVINITFNAPSDKGTTYNYQLKAVKDNGDVIGSEVKPVTITSGIKGYSYIIDSNPNTIPDNIVDVTTPKINHTINPNVKNYIHIKVIDNEGNVSDVFHQEIGIPVLTATPVHAEDYIHLEWDMKDDSKQYTYMVYKKAEGESEYQTIPVKDTLKVLEVYPYMPVLRDWTDAYGMGKITTNSVSIEDFNANPTQIWNYDVAVFGFADSNYGKDLNPTSSAEVEKFIQSGRGVLFGHDTMRYLALPNFCRLAPYLNMTFDESQSGPWFYGNNGNGRSTIQISKKGFLTNYPYKIGDVGTKLSTPLTHTVHQYANGDIWIKFVDSQDANMNKIDNFYLTTWNNAAMIQTGHSIRKDNDTEEWATPDEQKLIVNTLFYLAQISDVTEWDDHTGQDVTGPTKPTITDVRMINNGNTIHVEYTASEDIGTKYYYYIEGTAPNTKVQSNIADATIKSGLKGYSIVVDQNPSTVPDNTIETTSLEYNINQRFYQKFYVHVAAVDNVGNISEVAHYECTDTVPPILNVTGNATTWTNQDVVLTATASDNESGLKGIKLPDGTWVYSDTAKYTVTSNGSYTFTAEDNFGNQKSITIVVDKIDKTSQYNTSIIINNDALYTNNRNVVLTISAQDNATGVSQMRFKTENSPWSAWVPYGTTFNYTMDAGFTHQGTNRVYVQFKDGVGNVGGDAFDSIIFDNIAPTGEIIYPKNTTNTRSITLTINAYDINPASADAISGLNSVRFRELQDGVVKRDWTSWEQHNFTRNWILSDEDGVKVIEMEIRDNAGNIGKVSKSIVLDTLFIKEALFTDIVNPPLGNPELPTSEVVKVKKGYEFTFIVKTTGEPDYATYTFNGETGYMIKLADNLFTKTLKVDINDDSVDNELLPINITVARNDGTQKTTTLKVHVEGSAYDDFNINLTN